MSIRAIAASVLLLSSTLIGQTAPSLTTEMGKLRVGTVLVFRSSAIDDSPVWSPDGRSLAANVMGKWYKADLSSLRLQEGRWHELRIGVARDQKNFPPADKSEVDRWLSARSAKQAVVSASGITATFQRIGLSTALVLSKGDEAKTIWRTDLENCGSLSASLDGKFAAFICETNGVFVIDIDAVYAHASQ